MCFLLRFSLFVRKENKYLGEMSEILFEWMFDWSLVHEAKARVCTFIKKETLAGELMWAVAQSLWLLCAAAGRSPAVSHCDCLWQMTINYCSKGLSVCLKTSQRTDSFWFLKEEQRTCVTQSRCVCCSRQFNFSWALIERNNLTRKNQCSIELLSTNGHATCDHGERTDSTLYSGSHIRPRSAM